MKKRVAGLCLMLTLCLSFSWGISAHAEEDDEGEFYVYDDPNEVVWVRWRKESDIRHDNNGITL